jgi:hypothetical protein
LDENGEIKPTNNGHDVEYAVRCRKKGKEQENLSNFKCPEHIGA